MSSFLQTSGVDRAQLAEASSVSSQSSPCHKATSQSSLDGLRSAVPDSSLPNSSSSSSALLPNSPSHSVTSPTLQQDSVTTSHSSSSFQTDHHSDGDPCGDIQVSVVVYQRLFDTNTFIIYYIISLVQNCLISFLDNGSPFVDQFLFSHRLRFRPFR